MKPERPTPKLPLTVTSSAAPEEDAYRAEGADDVLLKPPDEAVRGSGSKVLEMLRSSLLNGLPKTEPDSSSPGADGPFLPRISLAPKVENVSFEPARPKGVDISDAELRVVEISDRIPDVGPNEGGLGVGLSGTFDIGPDKFSFNLNRVTLNGQAGDVSGRMTFMPRAGTLDFTVNVAEVEAGGKGIGSGHPEPHVQGKTLGDLKRLTEKLE